MLRLLSGSRVILPLPAESNAYICPVGMRYSVQERASSPYPATYGAII